MTRRKRANALGDPRIERSRYLVLQASLEELGDAGYGAFTIESVAARSGVAKSTIYRHWRDKLALIADAFQTFHEERGPDLTTGSAREKLRRIVRHVAEVVGESVFSACIPALIDAAERDARLRKFHHRFQFEARRPLVAVIADGIAAGEFAKHVVPDAAASAVLGAIFYRRLMTAERLDPAGADEIIETIFGVAPRGLDGRKRRRARMKDR